MRYYRLNIEIDVKVKLHIEVDSIFNQLWWFLYWFNNWLIYISKCQSGRFIYMVEIYSTNVETTIQSQTLVCLIAQLRFWLLSKHLASADGLYWCLQEHIYLSLNTQATRWLAKKKLWKKYSDLHTNNLLKSQMMASIRWFGTSSSS